MVLSPAAGPHPPTHERAAPAGNRAGHGGRLHAVSVSVAAYRIRIAAPWRSRPLGDYPATGRIRGCGLGLGAVSAANKNLQIRSSTVGPALPEWLSGLGQAFTPPTPRGRPRPRPPTTDHPDQRCSDQSVPERGHAVAPRHVRTTGTCAQLDRSGPRSLSAGARRKLLRRLSQGNTTRPI